MTQTAAQTSPTIRQVDTFRRWAQLSGRLGVQLVRLTAGHSNNTYSAIAVEFDAQGATQPVDSPPLTVLNLAEPANQPGTLPPDAEAVAIDVEGRWVIFVYQPPQQAPAGACMARVVEPLGSAMYTVIEQVACGQNIFVDRPGAIPVAACNLAEISLGGGAGVSIDTRVLMTSTTDNGSPPVVRFLFDHPVYAKYLN